MTKPVHDTASIYHALILVDIKNGDLLHAWTLALKMAYVSKHSPEEKRYWIEVADAIAQFRPRATVSAEFLRGAQFSFPDFAPLYPIHDFSRRPTNEESQTPQETGQGPVSQTTQSKN